MSTALLLVLGAVLMTSVLGIVAIVEVMLRDREDKPDRR
jgi:hypothetical protein